MSPGFWDNAQKAAAKQKEISSLKEETEKIISLKSKLEEINEAYREIGEDEKVLDELSGEISNLGKELAKEKFRVFLSGKFDKNDAIIEISSGTGGRDAEDFVSMLLRMYERYAERRGYKTKIISASYGDAGGPEGRVGIKGVALEISGEYAFGFLKSESGVHRLVRKSPFSSSGLRHTSFAKVEVFPKAKEKDTEVEIREEDLRIDTFRASGPGGQYVNRRESAVRITHLPTKIVVSSQSERLQGENKKNALGVLMSKLQKIKEEDKKKELEKAKGKSAAPSWGNQIRNYVLHPYNLVKDLKAGVETSNVEDVLDGNLDIFIQAVLNKE